MKVFCRGDLSDGVWFFTKDTKTDKWILFVSSDIYTELISESLKPEDSEFDISFLPEGLADEIREKDKENINGNYENPSL